ncbi:hypothetical protein L226DRAFT_572225 [Lentinus tigrinus ALCF2SS1-7]|uniref:Uncharacterized protein n=1 Tax=Lentinus tigrinus ALCF2SS1-6 TaxID=1328759 RepID=A0A5C2S5Z3_9APHY|nr:hypothetical protein L227DRAFT_612213 [Lentinus tigrinus ALCF2SS1-6]RPD73560.1 hypothetical protein L226DRAFT_572225 [Lentinus tigrinus ALCF2SS1-7]
MPVYVDALTYWRQSHYQAIQTIVKRHVVFEGGVERDTAQPHELFLFCLSFGDQQGSTHSPGNFRLAKPVRMAQDAREQLVRSAIELCRDSINGEFPLQVANSAVVPGNFVREAGKWEWTPSIEDWEISRATTRALKATRHSTLPMRDWIFHGRFLS